MIVAIAVATVLRPEPVSRSETRPELPAVPLSVTAQDWPALAGCESSGNPRAVDPSGEYFGLYQFDRQTWLSVGGHGLPSAASPAEQTRRAAQLYLERGASPWPICGRYL